jgi:hypothetical protein
MSVTISHLAHDDATPTSVAVTAQHGELAAQTPLADASFTLTPCQRRQDHLIESHL